MEQLSDETAKDTFQLRGKLNWWSGIINSGVKEQQDIQFANKLRSRNTLSALCFLFSLTYLAYFSKELQLIPLLGISLAIFGFYLSIRYNRLGKYTLSSALLLTNTNYCVLFFSAYLGFDSGIHLYLFTSPLILLALFDIRNYRYAVLSMSSYLVNFILVIFIGKYLGYRALELEPTMLSLFYLLNFSFCMFIVVALTLNLYRNNKTINYLLVLKNRELELKQVELEKENKIRKLAEDEAKAMLKQKEMLLSEIHHRVKNNLAVISGLMELQGFFISDRNTLDLFRESKGRVKALALLFEKLYENNTLEKVNLTAYMEDLVRFTSQTHLHAASIHLELNIAANSELDIQEATPVAMMLNELLSNSYKHAFQGRTEGRISLTFLKQNDHYMLSYCDNGIGYFPQEEEETTSLGLNLIDSFSRQLNGNYEFKKEKGTVFQLRFPAN
ncbi:MAG: sensor histidine kinase [Bacteroidia bacterium]